MSNIGSTDKIRSDIEGLLADRGNLLDLRQMLDRHRGNRYSSVGGAPTVLRQDTDEEVIIGLVHERQLARDELATLRKVLDGHRKMIQAVDRAGKTVTVPEPDEEVIARLAKESIRPFTHFTDETGRAIGQYVGTRTERGLPILQTNDVRGKGYAKGFWNGVRYTKGMDGAVIEMPSYDSNRVKVDSGSWGLGGVQSFHPAPECPQATFTCSTGAGWTTSAPMEHAIPEPLTDHQCAEFQQMGSAAFWGVSNRPDCPDGPPQAVQAWQRGWDAAARNRDMRRAAKQTTVLEAPTPKPIRLHAGQTWRHPDGGETCLTYLGPSRGVDQYGFGGFTMDIGPDWTVIDARGNVLIAGPGFTG